MKFPFGLILAMLASFFIAYWFHGWVTENQLPKGLFFLVMIPASFVLGMIGGEIDSK